MKFVPALLFAFCIFCFSGVTQAADPAESESRIVGEWEGLGMGLLLQMEFKSDHTFRIPDEPGLTGTWEFKDDKFTIKDADGSVRWTAVLDPEGRLILSLSDEPGFETALRKKGTAATAQPAAPQAPPTGEWHFASIKRSSISAAPPFDTVVFGETTATFGFTPVGLTIEHDYKLQNNNIITLMLDRQTTFAKLMNFMPLGFAQPRMLMIGYRWEDDGHTLILSNFGASPMFACEWVFLRPDRFTSNQLAETWVGKGSYTGNFMDMRPEGVLQYREYGEPLPADVELPVPKMYYRLWKSQFGDAITTVQMTPGMQLLHVQMAHIEREGPEIILTPIEIQYGETQRLGDDKANWKVMAEGEFADMLTAMAKTSDTTPTITALDLAGEWEGGKGQITMGYVFYLDGTVDSKMSHPEFDVNGRGKSRFKIEKALGLHQITFHRFTNKEFEGESFTGLIEMIDENTLRMEIGEGKTPFEFSIESVVFTRKGARPDFSAKDLETFKQASETPAAPKYPVASLPVQTIMLPGNVKLEMVRIPAGSFSMGSADPDEGGWRNHPQKNVTIEKDYFVGKTEVTQAQWLAVMGKWPLEDDEEPGSHPFVKYAEGDNYPAYFLSWDDCQKFVAALNEYIEKSDQGAGKFRLPTEAEWEYACRAGTQTRFYWGDDATLADIDNYAWSGNNSALGRREYSVHEVARKLPNPWGLYDMSGNLNEWCSDAAGRNDGQGSRMYVMRGGGYDNSEQGLSSSFRFNELNYRNYGHGMRLARDIDAAE